MQVKVYRQSGRPVNPEDEQRYFEDWRVYYDKAGERAKLDMMKLTRFLSFGAYMLNKKYYKEVVVDSLEQLKEMHLNVGHPLLIGVDAQSLELIAIIQDN